MGFLKTICVIVIFYYLFKMIMRLVATFLLKHFANKMHNRFQQQFNQEHQKQQVKSEEEGSITIKTTETPNQNKLNDLGEYVDFEEIDE
ncbi:MAG: DUF4834 family protein [Bacteroidota bacterium]|nr:DUF4834 family protein [Bacteroidota bacterium]